MVWEYRQGIPLGSPLSPVLGAFYLYELDRACTRRGLWYVRYMDDILILTSTRWRLRTPHGVTRLRGYVRRWMGWAGAGLTAPPPIGLVRVR